MSSEIKRKKGQTDGSTTGGGVHAPGEPSPTSPSSHAAPKGNPSPNLVEPQGNTADGKRGRDPAREPIQRHADIIESTEDVIYIADGEGRILFLNRAVKGALGYEREELIGKGYRDIMLPDSYAEASRIFQRQLGGEDVGAFELRFKRKDGRLAVIEAKEQLVWEEDRVVEVRGIGRDVTEKVQAERRLIENEARYRLLVDRANDIIYQTDIKGRITFFNASAVKMTGYTEQEITTKHYLDLVRPDFRPMAHRFYERQFARKTADTYLEIPIVTKGGDILWLGQNVQISWDRGKIAGFSAIARDITDRRRAEDALRESEQRYREIIQNIEEGYYEVDLSGNFTYFNGSMARILGYSAERMMGMNNREYMNKETAKRVFSTFHKVYETSLPARALDWEFIRKDGREVFVEVSVSLITDPMGRPVGFRGIARDITKRKEFEEELKRLSITDSVTGLFNQRHFYTRIEGELKRAKRMEYSLSLILIDLDNFKSYNDTYGHLAGDDVLKQVARIILRCIRMGMDTAFRYGGDEFAIILPSITEEGARPVAERIRQGVVTTIRSMDISIGISSLSEDDSVTGIIRAADNRMYAQKGLRKKPPE